MRISLLLITVALAACTVESAVSISPGADGGPADAAARDAGLGGDDVARGDTSPTDVPTTTESAVPTPDAPCIDDDSDGYPTSECGGMAPDCDDNNPMRNPGRTEVCDSMGADEDCNPCTVAGAADGDGDRDTFIGAGCFNRYAGAAPASCGPAVRIDGAMLRVVGRDCDDTNNNVRPDQTENCNNRDDNCNGEIDEGLATRMYWIDADNDTYGDRRATGQSGCSIPSGRSDNNLDCNDRDPAVRPTATEACNGLDDNCDDRTDEGNPGGGAICATGLSGACAAGQQTCVSAAVRCVASVTSVPERCDAVDNDCDGVVDEGLGQTECGVGACRVTIENCVGGMLRACAPRSPTSEVCNGQDDNCNGTIDDINHVACWTGNASNRSRGSCRDGTLQCSGSSTECRGQQLPQTEDCGPSDLDCDGNPWPSGPDQCGPAGSATRSCRACVGATNADLLPAGRQTCSGSCSYGGTACVIPNGTVMFNRGGADSHFGHLGDRFGNSGRAEGVNWVLPGGGAEIYGPSIPLPSGTYTITLDMYNTNSASNTMQVTTPNGLSQFITVGANSGWQRYTLASSYAVTSPCSAAVVRVNNQQTREVYIGAMIFTKTR